MNDPTAVKVTDEKDEKGQFGVGPSELEGHVCLVVRWKHDGEAHVITCDVPHEEAICVAAFIVRRVPDGETVLAHALAKLGARDIIGEIERAVGEGSTEPKGA